MKYNLHGWSPEHIYQSQPNTVVYQSQQKIIVYQRQPKIIVYKGQPKIVVYQSQPNIVVYQSQPSIVGLDFIQSACSAVRRCPGKSHLEPVGDVVCREKKNNSLLDSL